MTIFDEPVRLTNVVEAVLLTIAFFLVVAGLFVGIGS